MNLSIPKINLGKSSNSFGKFDLTHDVNTTSDIGFFQPLMCKLLTPQSSATCKVNSFVRMFPMPKPTFGRVSWRVYHHFVKCADLFMPFENMLSGQSYSTINNTYVPTSVPTVSVSILTKFVLHHSQVSIYGRVSADSAYRLIVDNSVKVQFLSIYTNTYLNGLAYAPSYLPSLNNALSMDDTEVPPVSIDGADYLISIPYTYGDFDNLVFAFRFNNNGKRLRKILLGLGYQLDIANNTSLNALPLFAYYKAWFEIFSPKRSSLQTWTASYAYKCLDYFRVSGLYNIDSLLNGNQFANFFGSFMSSLALTYYTTNPDFVSAHINTPAISNISTPNLVLGSPNGLVPMVSSTSVGANSQPYMTNASIGSSGSGSNSLSITRLNVLTKLYSFVNKNTVIGGRIADYLRTHYGADYVDDHSSDFIGSTKVECQIGDVMANNYDPDNSYLGEYAGRGIGYSNDSDTMKYRTNSFGYWVVLACIVPESGYVQMIDPSLTAKDRFTFYTPEFDGVGFEITNKSSIYGSNEVIDNVTDRSEESFGYIPRFTGAFKIAPNLLNGDLSRRGSRADMLAYTLDRFITPTDAVAVRQDTSEHERLRISFVNSNIPIASDEWRYIARYPWLGNLNRIFYNEGAFDITDDEQVDSGTQYVDDNFVIHNVIEFHMSAPMKSIANSFETFADDEHEATSVEHS